MGRRALTSEDVRKLVFLAIEMIGDVQRETKLPICPKIDETQERLRKGDFRTEILNLERYSMDFDRNRPYKMDYGAFEPPSTIILDSELPFSDKPLSIPQLPETLAIYSATHEVIHADDFTGGDTLQAKTCKHILRDHMDKLEKGMWVIEQGDDTGCIGSLMELAELWALQYVDMVTHYRAYYVLRHRQLPMLDLIWSGLHNDFFPPTLLTFIERHRGADYIFDTVTRRAGSYCLIEALREFEGIGEKSACSYTV